MSSTHVPFLCCSTGVFTAAFDCQIEWLIVKGIADYADGSQLPSESWSSCASVMAASLVSHILSEPCVFHSWPHYQGDSYLFCLCCHLNTRGQDQAVTLLFLLFSQDRD